MRRGDNRPGLLSDGEIRHFAEHHKMIREFEPKQLRPAAYDLRVATDGLVTPEGETYKPAFLPDGRRYDGGIALMPGDTAEFSSREQFDMPPNVAGNISIKTDLARRGLLLLSGLLIDPGYGTKADNVVSDGRLHFYVANIGSNPIALTPGETSIAAVQFFRVMGDPDRDRKPVEPPKASQWDARRPRHRLGFINTLKTLNKNHETLAMEVDRTRERTLNVLVLGYFLLGATILGLTLDNLLSVGSDPSLVDRVATAVPDGDSGKALLGVIFVSMAWIVRSLAQIVQREPPGTERDDPEERLYVDEARRKLIVRRRRVRAYIAAVAVPLALALVEAANEAHFRAEPYVWLAAAGLLACAIIGVDQYFYEPITGGAVTNLADKLERQDRPEVSAGRVGC